MTAPDLPALPPEIAALVRALEQAAIEHGAGKTRGMTMVLARAALVAALAPLVRDAERLDALDCFCRRIALHAVAGTEPRSEYVFRWQIDHYGLGSPRPSLREAIDAARTPTGGTPT